MLPKLRSAIDAIDDGVDQVHILDGRMQHAVLLEIFTPEGIGTMITKEPRL
jgi:acetylglutamate kinase